MDMSRIGIVDTMDKDKELWQLLISAWHRRKRGRPQSRFMFVEEDDIHRDRVTDVAGMG